MRKFLLIVFLMILTAGAVWSATKEFGSRDLAKYPVRFAIVGDRSDAPQPGVYEQILAEIERLKPEFVITIGDMINGCTEDSVILSRQWQEYMSLLESLSMPVYFTPGNHDITTDGQEAAYRRFTGSSPYYSFDYDGLHFVVLDNSRWRSVEEFPASQIDWLIDDLSRSSGAKCTMVLYHRFYWYYTLAQGRPDTLHSIFRTYGVDAVFSGHWHRYFTGKYDDILYTCVGSSGGRPKVNVGNPGYHFLRDNPGYHFLWVTANEKGLSITPVKIDAVLPWDEVTVEEIQYYEAMIQRGISFVNHAPVGESSLTVGRTTVDVDISNLSNEFVLKDSIYWSVPEGWSVEPSRLSVSAGPGQVKRFTFEVSSEGPLFPLPYLQVDFPCKGDETLSIERELRVAREAPCALVTEAPVIDGKLTENIWRVPRCGLFDFQEKPAQIDSAEFYFAYDSDNIYFAARCFEAEMDSVRAMVKDQEDPELARECVAFLFWPQRGDSTIYEIRANLLGAIYDEAIAVNAGGHWWKYPSWNGQYEIAAGTFADRWEVEIKLPLSQFGVELESGEACDFNFGRRQWRRGARGYWQMQRYYFHPDRFGRLEFQ